MAVWIEKQRSVLDFTLSSLLRRKGKNVSLLLVYVLIIFVSASAMFFTQAMKKEAALILKDTPELVIQRLMQGRYDPIPISYLDKIRTIKGVTSAHTRLWGYIYDSVVGANYTLIVPRNPAVSPEKIIIGNGISRSRLIYRGDMMAFRTFKGDIRTFTVENVTAPESELISALSSDCPL